MGKAERRRRSSICSCKIANKCPRHPSSSSKAYYRMRVLLNQDDVELWVTAFDETAAALNNLGIIIFIFLVRRI